MIAASCVVITDIEGAFIAASTVTDIEGAFIAASPAREIEGVSSDVTCCDGTMERNCSMPAKLSEHKMRINNLVM